MKKLLSILLTGLMAFSAVAVGAVSASATEADPEEPALAFAAGSDIYFDNTNTNWENVYLYSWGMGYFGDFVPMEAVAGEDDLYSVVAPVDVAAGSEVFLFTNTTDWSGQQTPNIVTQEGKNKYTPVVSSTGSITVEQSALASSTAAKVVATPNSKSFTNSLDVTVYAFNTDSATYQVGDAAAVAFTGSTVITLTDTATVTVSAGSVSKSYTYTKIADAVITVTTSYTGDMYIYTYGGDRVGASFSPMENKGNGTYTYTINGSAHVIFTTTNDWNTAVKFTIYDKNGNLLDNQEPFVDNSTDNEFYLELPTV